MGYSVDGQSLPRNAIFMLCSATVVSISAPAHRISEKRSSFVVFVTGEPTRYDIVPNMNSYGTDTLGQFVLAIEFNEIFTLHCRLVVGDFSDLCSTLS